MKQRELIFTAIREHDGGYSANAVGESIFTQGDTWEDLQAMIEDAIECHFGEEVRFVTPLIRLNDAKA